MSKKRLAAAGALVAALTVSGVAAAGHRSQATQQAAADFSAGSVTRTHTKTCTASDGAYQETTATYSGTASSSDARLNGPLEIRASSVVNTTTGVGWVEGSFRIRGSDAAANGTIHAALAGGNAVGAVVGRGRHNDGQARRVVRRRLHAGRRLLVRQARLRAASNGAGVSSRAAPARSRST